MVINMFSGINISNPNTLKFGIAAGVALGCTAFYLLRKSNALYVFTIRKSASENEKSDYLNNLKQSLFGTIEEGSTIVEIGAGGGANFGFYPRNCSVICVEPKVDFKGDIVESARKNGEHLQSINFVEGAGENLSQVVSTSSCDYVVSTMVLCSVKNLDEVFSEVKKVLKPGGKFLFLEHVIAPEEYRFTRMYLHILTQIFKLIFGHNHGKLNRQPWIEIERAGFAKTNFQRVINDSASRFSPLKWLFYGVATV